MTPGRIRDSNFVYKAPDDHENCGDLHVQVYQDDSVRIITSAWIPTPDEVKRISEGAPIWLHVYGSTHPVVAMSVPNDELG